MNAKNPFDRESNVITEILGKEWIDTELNAYQSFREEWSPKDSRWYHRRPTVSPIVPILYWNLRMSTLAVGQPFGSWGGVPEEVLNRLTEELERFRSYWEKLPEERGINNLRFMLTTPQRYFSMVHEMATAFQFSARPSVQVEPLFLDSQAERGKPDIMVRTPQREFAVQCKSEDPSRAKQLPYDLFQYFAGIYQRLVEDSGKSYSLTLQLKKKIDMEELNGIRNRIKGLIRNRLTVPYAWKTPCADIELSEIGSEMGAQTVEQLRRQALGIKSDPLYHEFVPVGDDSPLGLNRRGSILFIFGRRSNELYEAIRSAVGRSVAEASTKLPLIVAVHVYQDVDLSEFWNRQTTQQWFRPWTDQFFKQNPNVAMIFLSSNYELYLPRRVNDTQAAVKYVRKGFVLESPEWDHRDLEQLGI